MFKYIFNLNTYLSFLLGIVAVCGDYIVHITKIHIFQAIFDNATHAIIGGLSWLLICLNYKKELGSFHIVLEIAACSFLSSIIDIDHFVAAKSIHLKDATNLKRRPALHCSTFPLVTCSFFLLLSYFLQWPMIKRYTLIILTAFMSHHTRDAARHGYWFYPYGSTPPLPYITYVLLSCITPYLISNLYSSLDLDSNHYKKVSVI